MRRISMMVLAFVWAGSAMAQQGVSGGGGSFNVGFGGVGSVGCSEVTSMVANSWFDVKRVMTGSLKGVRRPRARDLQCISGEHVQSMWTGSTALPKSTPGARNLRCFELDDGTGTCCDQDVYICAVYAP